MAAEGHRWVKMEVGRGGGGAGSNTGSSTINGSSLAVVAHGKVLGHSHLTVLLLVEEASL